MKRAIFISYRRDDTEGEAGRLFDDLTQAFGKDSVFMDVDGIAPGMDFRKAIEENVSGCGVLLAVIGKTWASVTGADGRRRLDEPTDFVRLEIATALQRNIAVIPVMVHGANMPRPDEFPEELKDLAYRNSVEITHARWNSDVQLLVEALKHYVASSSASDTRPVHAAVPVQLPAPAPALTERQSPAKRSHSGSIAIGAIATAILCIGGYLYVHNRNVPSSPNGNAAAQQPVPSPVSTATATRDVAPAATNEDSEHTAAVSKVAATADAAGRGGGARMPLHPKLYIGPWLNPSPEGNNGLVRISVSRENDGLTMHAWGNCGRTECDWGAVPCTMNVYRLEGKFELGPNAAAGLPSRVALVSVFPQNGALDVMITNTFVNHPATYRQFTFQRPR